MKDRKKEPIREPTQKLTRTRESFMADADASEVLKRMTARYDKSKTQVIKDGLVLLNNVDEMSGRGFRLYYEHPADSSRRVEVWILPYMGRNS